MVDSMMLLPRFQEILSCIFGAQLLNILDTEFLLETHGMRLKISKLDLVSKQEKSFRRFEFLSIHLVVSGILQQEIKQLHVTKILMFVQLLRILEESGELRYGPKELKERLIWKLSQYQLDLVRNSRQFQRKQHRLRKFP